MHRDLFRSSMNTAGKLAITAIVLVLLFGVAANGQQLVHLRINCGGALYEDTTGARWDADTGFHGGAATSRPGEIKNTNTPTLYETVRYGEGDFHYLFDVP